MKKEDPFHFVALPAERSYSKPRASGLTMIIDDGMPLGKTEDLISLAGNYIDLAKIKTGTARLYPREMLQKKLRMYQERQIRPFLGGQFHEYVFATGGEAALPAFYDEALALGFEAIEISDNVVPLTDAQRVQQIRAAIGTGLIVFGEVGSKETISNPTLLVRQAELCFDAGAALVLVEAAELVENGKLRSEVMQLLVRELDMKRVMIELPGPWISGVHSCDIESMKRELFAALGPDLNLANVAPTSIIDTEATRVGLGTAGPLKKGARLMR
jgi:phosphosulfolactate synthase